MQTFSRSLGKGKKVDKMPKAHKQLALPHASVVIDDDGLAYDIFMIKSDIKQGAYGTHNFYIMQVC